MRVESNVPDATVWVDDVLVGNVSDWAREGKHIRAGFHRIEIRAQRLLLVLPGSRAARAARTTVVNAQLRPTDRVARGARRSGQHFAELDLARHLVRAPGCARSDR